MVSCTLLWILFVIISYLFCTCSLFSKNIIIKYVLYALVIMWYSGLSTKQSRYNINIFIVEHLSECDYTPLIIVRQEVDGDVMDAPDIRQVNPPGGGLIAVTWYSTLTSMPTQIWFTSVYGIIGVISVVSCSPWIVLVCWFVYSDINC